MLMSLRHYDDKPWKFLSLPSIYNFFDSIIQETTDSFCVVLAKSCPWKTVEFMANDSNQWHFHSFCVARIGKINHNTFKNILMLCPRLWLFHQLLSVNVSKIYAFNISHMLKLDWASCSCNMVFHPFCNYYNTIVIVNVKIIKNKSHSTKSINYFFLL